MRIECGHCHATYNVPDEKVAGRPFKITCKRCKNIIHVQGSGENSGAKTVELSSSELQARLTGEFAAADGRLAANAPLAELQANRTAWYLAFGKSKHGPLSQDDIHKLLTETRPEGDIYVWRSGYSAWKALAETPEFSATLRVLNPDAVPAQEPQAQPLRSRPSFTELVGADSNGEEATTAAPPSQKLDILSLMQQGTEAPTRPKSRAKKRSRPSPPCRRQADGLCPSQEKEIPLGGRFGGGLRRRGHLGTPVYLALQRVINIPFLATLPVVGHNFVVHERDRYAELKAELSQLIKIEEDKVAIRQAAAEEEKAAIAAARAEARKEREERLLRAAEWKNRIASGGGGGGAANGGGGVSGFGPTPGRGGGGSSIEFDFGGGDDGLDTEGDLKLNEIDRKKVLTQGEIIGILNRNSAALSRCVADYRRLEKDGAKKRAAASRVRRQSARLGGARPTRSPKPSAAATSPTASSRASWRFASRARAARSRPASPSPSNNAARTAYGPA